MSNPKQIFNVWVSPDEQIVIDKLFQIPHCSLESNADWALGIVTGDNKNKCYKMPAEGLVPIYRGKDITPDTVLKKCVSSRFMNFEMSN